MSPTRRTGPATPAADPLDTQHLPDSVHPALARSRRMSRWARHELDVLLGHMLAADDREDFARLAELASDMAAAIRTTPAPTECGQWHPGSCDWWNSCTGMSLGWDERDVAGTRHPWRVSA